LTFTVLDAGTPPTLHTGLPTWTMFCSLAALFGLSELLALTIEFRRQAHTITLSSIPIVLGALLGPVPVVVLARVLGGGMALAYQRKSLDKFAYNVTFFACEAALLTTLVHHAIGSRDSLDLTGELVVLGVAVAVDQFFSLLVLLMIRIHNGPVTLRDAIGVLAPAAAMTAVSVAVASGIVMLVRLGAAGAIVVGVTLVVATMLYRGYLHATRRHAALELVHDFVTSSSGAESIADAAHGMLERIRTLLRATTVSMAVIDAPEPGDSDEPALPRTSTRFIADEDGFSVETGAAEIYDWAVLRALTQHQPMLAPRKTRDPATAEWLREHGYRDAMVVSFPPSSGVHGTITLTDRLGETATFTSDDLALLQTLTGHLAVSARSAQMVERLAYDANHDALTGLPNRVQLSRRIAQHADDPHGAAVLLLDLDRFKEVNDALGHAAGDRLLNVVAERLVAAAPTGATVARLGGDEFAIHIAGLGDDGPTARAIGDRIAVSLSRSVAVEGAQVSAEASIGVAVSAAGAPNSGDLLRQADTAMYAAKSGEAKVCVYHPDMDRGRVENLAMLAELRVALRERPEQFVLLYQPQVDLKTREVVSAEALARWHHPSLGVVTPDRFIPLLETSGLIDELMPIVLDGALRECRRWHDRGVPISVSVNLSARNAADSGLPRQVAAALRRASLPPSSLIIEVTESSLVSEQHQKVLIELAEQGVGISLDDFGTGYSSLSYLQRLSVQEVKIDRSFVSGLTNTPEASQALIAGVASLCSALDLRVVAEGAETDEIVDQLAELGCDVVQGYAIARPMSADNFAQWVLHPPIATPLTLIKAVP
jgi:diguanylate cyclase (GGDEF)-like protein